MRHFSLLFLLSVFISGWSLQTAFGQATVRVYVKLSMDPEPGSRVRNAISVSSIQSMEEVETLRPLIEENQSARKVNKSRLEGIYRLETRPDGVEDLIKRLNGYSNIVEVVEEPQVELLLIPNDSLRSNQDYLALVQAYEAWDITTGSNEIVVGISDNGVDYVHEDLVGNHFFNELDPVNGIDDDGNGYVDDYIGVDIADNDNDPSPDLDQHGSAVAGIISATTNNTTGISGVGYQSNYFPIKVFRSDGSGSLGTYESIVYAANLGLDVINLSWGAVNEPFQILQDIIDFAVIDNDMVIIAAAGNTNEELNFHPASYDNVLSIGASKINDEKADFATYSYHIDLMAPGESVFSTRKNDTYGSEAGSSFAAPQVAGAAALVRDVFPELSAIQVMERIRMTSDDVYDVGNNMNYYGQLGKGRLNVYRAVSEEDVASLRCYDYSVSGPSGDRVFFGDTVLLNLNFVNWLRPQTGAEVAISTESGFVEILNDRLILGSVFTFDSLANQSITMVLSENTPPEERLIFRLDYSDAQGYEDFEYVEFWTSSDYIMLDNGAIEFTVASDGSSSRDYDLNGEISAVGFGSSAVANYTGLIVGTEVDSISDNIITDYGVQSFSDDFQKETHIKLRHREDIQQYARSIFSDSLADNLHGLRIEQELMSWTDTDSSDFLITEYFVTNLSNDPKVNLNFGYYVDFDIEDSVQNFAAWDAVYKLGYTYGNGAETTFAGVAVLSSHAAQFHAIDLFDAVGDPIDFDGSWEESEKFNLVSSEKLTAGGVDGNNVGQVVTAQIPSLLPNTSEKIAFAMVFGSDTTELRQNLTKALDKYNSFLQAPDINWIIRSCANVPISLANENPILLYSDPLGTLLEDSGTEIELPGMSGDSVLYYREEIGGYQSDIYGLKVQISQPEASFRADPDTLFLDDTPENRVQFIDTGIGPVEWSWDFGNGSFSSLQNPRAVYTAEGTYLVTMSVISEQGCANEVSQNFEVLVRGEAPIVSDHEVCAGETATISATNSSSLRFYAQPQDEAPFFEGPEWTTDPLMESETYYVSSDAGSVESIKVPVNIVIDPIDAQFVFQIDTLDLSSSQLIGFVDESTDENTIEWLMNDQSQGGGASLTYDYTSLSSLEAKLVATSSAGCQDSLTQVIDFTSSPNAGVTEQTICAWNSVTVRPVNGDKFIYYSDMAMTTILAKGSRATFELITSDSSFWVTNVSNYLESDPVEFEVRTVDHDPSILASPDSLELAASRSVTFSTDAQNLVSHWWYMNDVLIETVSSPTLIFDTLGVYDIQLISEHELGCLDTTFSEYLVYEVLGLDDPSNGLNIYPVPAENRLFITSDSGQMEIMSLHNAMGQTFEIIKSDHSEHPSILVNHLKPGLYIVSGKSSGRPFQIRFIKK